MGCKMTGPPCSVGRPTAHGPCARRPAGPIDGSVPAFPRYWRPALPLGALQTTTDDDDRHQPTKHYWPIRLASNNCS